MLYIRQKHCSVGALCCREKYYSATSSIVLAKYRIKYKSYPLISKKVKFLTKVLVFFVLGRL